MPGFVEISRVVSKILGRKELDVIEANLFTNLDIGISSNVIVGGAVVSP